MADGARAFARYGRAIASVSLCCSDKPDTSVYVRFRDARCEPGRVNDEAVKSSPGDMLLERLKGSGSRLFGERLLDGEAVRSLMTSGSSVTVSGDLASTGLSDMSSPGLPKLFSNTLSFTRCAGPVRGPASMPNPAEPNASGPNMFAFCKSSIMLSSSSSPANRA